MVKTFDEIINLYMSDNDIEYYLDITYNDWKTLMRFVREQTLIEAANKADVDYNIIDENEPDDPVEKDQIEVYVLKKSILGLDKNSIEL